MPALVCGSFSDHNLHSQGSINGFRRIASAHKWLYTHRGPKWATYYSPQVLATQARFFDHFLRDQDTGLLDEPSIRLEVCENPRHSDVGASRALLATGRHDLGALYLASGPSPTHGTLQD